jgi:hypothetical protein
MYKNEVSFTREAHRDLNNCAAIQMLIHVENKIVIIMPSTSTDENAIAWDRQLKDTSASKFFCPCLTNRLYALWDWNTKYKYKTDGRIVYCDKKVMILFDFNDAKPYDGLALAKENA